MSAPSLRVTGLFIYPVKSLRGFAVPAAEIDELGFVGDRRFLVIDDTGKFLTQRTHPRMALIATALSATALTLSTDDGRAPLSVLRATDPAAPLRPVSVWKSEGLLAEDCGDAASAWLSDFLKISARLVRAGEKYHRPVKPSAAKPGDVVSFADAHPFLLISEASLADLNDRLAEKSEDALPMDRFRPNIVLDCEEPWAEDRWTGLEIGGMRFDFVQPCPRCIMTSQDQQTGSREGANPIPAMGRIRMSADRRVPAYRAASACW